MLKSMSRQRDTQHREGLSHSTVCQTVYHADKHIFFAPWGNAGMHNTTYLELHIYKSQAGSQFGEALRKESEDAETKAFAEREREDM